MARFYGKVGYAEPVETSPGVWTERITEHLHSGDVLKISRSWQAGDKLNDNLTINNQISIVANPFAYQNFHAMRYVNWMGANWEINKIDVQSPRLILTIGGIYNGEAPSTSNTP